MPINGCLLLREAREKAGKTREQAANVCNVSPTTYKAWEYGERKPLMDDVDRLGEFFDDRTLWHRWMLETEPSYAKRYTGAESLNLPLSVVRVRHALADVFDHQEAMERDALDGKLDDIQVAAAYRKALSLAIAKLAEAVQYMNGG